MTNRSENDKISPVGKAALRRLRTQASAAGPAGGRGGQLTLTETLIKLTGYGELQGTQIAAFWIGVVAVIETLLIYISNRRERILALKMLSDILWSVQYLLFGSLTGGILCGIAIGRDFVFLNRGRRKWADHTAWLWVFIALMMISPVVDSVVNGFRFLYLLPAVGSAMAVVALFVKNTVATKSIMLVCSLLYLIYNIVTGNFMSIVGSVAPIISTTVGLIHELISAIKRRKEGEEEKEE